MAPKRASKKQQQLNVDRFKLLKKPMDHLGKQINVSGSFWQGRMLAEERDKVYKCTIVDFSLAHKFAPDSSPRKAFKMQEMGIDGCGVEVTVLSTNKQHTLSRAATSRVTLRAQCTRLITRCPSSDSTMIPFVVLLVVSGPSFAAKAGGAVSPTSPPPLSGVLFPKYSHLRTKNCYRQQVSRMAPPTVPRFFPPCIAHLTLTPPTPTVLSS
jgi:hypothetical protein